MAPAAVHNQQGSSHPTSFEPISTLSKSNSASSKKQNVNTTLQYYLDDGKEPAPAYVGVPSSYERPTAPLDVTVHDIRGDEGKYTLDTIGFQVHNHESKEKEFKDDEKIKAEYYPETEQLLKDATGASRIFIFDHTIRRATQDHGRISATDTANDPSKPITLRGPVNRVHIDQSYSAARNRVPHHLPELSEKLLSTRHQIINVWRPIKKIAKDPLTVADAHSVPEKDLVPVGLIYPDRRGETLSVKPNEAHKWYYLNGQTPEEVLLIKCYDSKVDGRARRVPHTAFVDPSTVNEIGRESIEVRALVFHENEPAE